MNYTGCALALLALGATAAFAQTPDGTKLKLGETCYTITTARDDVRTPIGETFQSVARATENGVDALAIVVHQRLAGGKFDMRDSFVVRRADLRPIRLDSARNGEAHVHLDYTDARVTGWKMDKGAKTAIDVAFDAPVWDGNLWGLTFAALPLKEGASFELPTYQYDSGKGRLLVKVEGQRRVDTANGAREAWVVKAGAQPERLVEYLIAREPVEELGYSAGPMAQRAGGACKDLR